MHLLIVVFLMLHPQNWVFLRNTMALASSWKGIFASLIILSVVLLLSLYLFTPEKSRYVLGWFVSSQTHWLFIMFKQRKLISIDFPILFFCFLLSSSFDWEYISNKTVFDLISKHLEVHKRLCYTYFQLVSSVLGNELFCVWCVNWNHLFK